MKPSEVCVIENMPAGSEPSCIRHDACRYWLSRLSGSSAWTGAGSNASRARQRPAPAKPRLLMPALTTFAKITSCISSLPAMHPSGKSSSRPFLGKVHEKSVARYCARHREIYNKKTRNNKPQNPKNHYQITFLCNAHAAAESCKYVSLPLRIYRFLEAPMQNRLAAKYRHALKCRHREPLSRGSTNSSSDQ